MAKRNIIDTSSTNECSESFTEPQAGQPVPSKPDDSRRRCGGAWSQAKYNSFIKSALRTASVRWPPRYQCLHDAFVEQGINQASGRKAKLYRCCKCEGLFPAAKIEINHIIPVVPVEGFDTWDALIERLFCEKEGLEAVCKDCHKGITAQENQQRKVNKKNGK